MGIKTKDRKRHLFVNPHVTSSIKNSASSICTKRTQSAISGRTVKIARRNIRKTTNRPNKVRKPQKESRRYVTKITRRDMKRSPERVGGAHTAGDFQKGNLEIKKGDPIIFARQSRQTVANPTTTPVATKQGRGMEMGKE